MVWKRKRKFLFYLSAFVGGILISKVLGFRKSSHNHRDEIKSSRKGLFFNDMGSRVKIPVVFIGHGSPMNAIQDSDYTRALRNLGEEIKREYGSVLKAVLVISAHWLTKGATFVLSSENPRIIHDFYGFPDILYSLKYPARGSPEIAGEIAKRLQVQSDTSWGLDHGAWVPLMHIFRDADVPVFQLSIDYSKPFRWHYELSKNLAFLRKKGVMIIGSGNITHNLRAISPFQDEPKVAFWAKEFDEEVKNLIISGNFGNLIEGRIKYFSISHPEPSHYIPLLYTLGLVDDDDRPSFIYEGFHHGSLSMRCIKFS